MAEIKCKFCSEVYPCPLRDVIEAGRPLGHGAFWCGDYAQQAECGNAAHEAKAKKISHKAYHGRTVRQIDMPRSTSVGSMEQAQSAEKLALFKATQEERRKLLQKHGVSTS